MPTVMVVEDEDDLRRGLVLNLKREGYDVVEIGRGDLAVDAVLKENPHLLLLDVMLPGENGVSICRELREKGVETPIIMLTAKAEEVDRVVGLEVGADDYVTKPFSMRELLARIQVQLRRSARVGDRGISRYKFGDVDIDFDRYVATKNGTSVDLTSKEFEIIRLLVQNRGELVSRDRMLDEVWGYEAFPTTRTVDNHILKLRKKLEDDPANPRFILSIYGEGYKFVG